MSSSEYPYSVQLNLAHRKELIESNFFGSFAQELAYLRVLSKWEPEYVRKRLREELISRPKHRGILILQMELAIEDGDYSTIDDIIPTLRSKTDIGNYWIPRFIRALDEGVIDHNGIKISVDRDSVDPIILRHLASGSYEAQEARIVAKSLQPDDRVLELGAAIGFLAILIFQHDPNIAYKGVEANPYLSKIIEKNMALNNCERDISFRVLGTKSETKTFNIARKFWGSSFMPVANPIDTVDLEIEDINKTIKQFDPSFLVMDIEGGEFELIPHISWNNIKKILFEIHPTKATNEEYTKVFKTLLDNGFLIDGETSKSRVFLLYRT
jgi:FkbM family methyltransferase